MDFNFLDIDAADITKEIITGLEKEVQEPLYPGDERRIFAEALSAVLVQMLNKINDDCKQRLLRYARNETLDALGERMQTTRLDPEPAKTILQFSLQAARDRDTYVPQGTRATPDGAVYFATIAAGIIAAGQTTVDIEAECTTGGSAYNGYTAGSISTITDVIPYVSGVTNTEATHDGDDGEPQDTGGPGDNRYRARIRLAPAKFSTAGAGAAYEYYALAASSQIKAVNICNDHDAGTVDIIVMTEDGEPSEDILTAVEAACSAKDVRAMNDQVNALAPTPAPYDIELKYYCTAENEQACINTIEGPAGAVEKYMEWQRAAIGRDINPDKLRAYCLAPAAWTDSDTAAGALMIDVVKPARTILNDRQLAKFSGNLAITHEVVAG